MSELEDKENKSILRKGQEFLNLHQKVESFTQELLKENERLRFKAASLEQEKKSLQQASMSPPSEELVGRLKALEQEKEELLKRYQQVEEENVDFAKRYLEIEEENNNLANLYVASFQLHSTLDFKEVVQIVMEIVINLVGAEKFSLMLLDENKGDLYAVSSEGVPREKIPHIKLGEGVVGQVAQEGSGPYIAEGKDRSEITLTEPLVVIPMKIKDQVIGAIVVYTTLEQKEGFSPLDFELFNLLAGHAATALFASKLYSESERKLSTIQGFLELLKQ
jgi:nitrate/nitrite-specific signal transduction histidine kinase